MNWLISDEKNIKKDSFIWNTIGAGFSACQSAVILFFVSRINGIENVGVVTIAFALANLFMTIGQYGITNFMVTDVKEKYHFFDYFYTRIFTSLAALFAAVVFLLVKRLNGSYSGSKALICLLLITMKMVETFLHVFHSRFQQMGRLDISAKIYALSIILSTIAICGGIICRLSLPAAIVAGILIYVLVFVCFTKKVFYLVVPKGPGRVSFDRVMKLLKVNFPLCVSTSLAIYNGNAPKYHIDAGMNETAQAIFGYIMMPMFVLYLFNGFILMPIIKELAEIWTNHDYVMFIKKIRNHCGILLLFSLVVLAGGCFVGLPVLSWMYVIDLSSYRNIFIIIMLGGVFYTLSSYFGTLLTTMRRLKPIMGTEILVAVVNITAGALIVEKFGMQGAAWLYVFVNLIAFAVKGTISLLMVFSEKST